MEKQMSKEAINSWEWLDSFCLTQRGDCNLACGQHAILVVTIDSYDSLKSSLSRDRMLDFRTQFEALLKTFALDDTIIAKYNDSTYVIVLHYLTDRDEIEEICQEIREAIADSSDDWGLDITASVGAAECHHDPNQGYKCAAALAMEAVRKAQATNEGIVIAPDTLPLHPLAVAMKNGSEY